MQAKITLAFWLKTLLHDSGRAVHGPKRRSSSSRAAGNVSQLNNYAPKPISPEVVGNAESHAQEKAAGATLRVDSPHATVVLRAVLNALDREAGLTQQKGTRRRRATPGAKRKAKTLLLHSITRGRRFFIFWCGFFDLVMPVLLSGDSGERGFCSRACGCAQCHRRTASA